jgi:hypothetical protein
MRTLALLALSAGSFGPQEPPADRKWDRMDYGPFLSTCVGMPWAKGVVVPKGIVVRVGEDKSASVCYDTDLLRCAAGWTGGFLKLMGPVFDGIRKPDEETRPIVSGTVRFRTEARPGWARGNDFADPRPEPYGPLPAARAKHRGLYVHGDRVILSYTVGDCPILEMPGFEAGAFTRTFRLGPSTEPLTLLVLEGENPAGAARVAGAPAGAALEVVDGTRLCLRLPPVAAPTVFKLTLGAAGAAIDDPGAYVKGGPARWGREVETKGAPGAAGGPYEVDTLTWPDENPWNSWMRFTGLDFFADGRAALSTWSGDVWIISGIDDKLEKLRWRRFAAGLFQPCGLRIVQDRLYVLGRDQITRLHDLNGDGEADFYENFNNDCTERGNYHEFAMDLNTDAEGNFYYCKGALGANFPGGPVAAHHGCMLKVPPDGSRLDIVATGIRAAAGSGVGPRGELTCADNDGHWGPSSRLNLVRPGGYYGDPNTAHRTPVPAGYDNPLCWIPRSVDNSSGGQVWVAGDRWGPFQGRLLHLSYGTCSLFHVLMETVDGEAQGGIVRFPLTFASGILRARFHPRDGQLYVAGVKGWSTSGSRDGCFQRVRYTGRPVHVVREMHVTKRGLELAFTNPVDAASAGDADNYSAQWWNYAYTEKYGSPDLSVADPKKQGRDPVEIKSAAVSADGRRVTLEIPGMRPVMQMLVRVRIKAADGSAVSQDVYHTIHRVP